MSSILKNYTLVAFFCHFDFTVVRNVVKFGVAVHRDVFRQSKANGIASDNTKESPQAASFELLMLRTSSTSSDARFALLNESGAA